MRDESHVLSTLIASRSWSEMFFSPEGYITTTRVQSTVNDSFISFDYRSTILHTTTLGHMELYPIVIKF